MSGASGEDDIDEAFANLLSLPEVVSTKREICVKCKRPATVCLCSSFPENPVPIETRLIILQHPYEESRSLATVPLLQQCVPKDRCEIIRGKRFGSQKNEVLTKALKSHNSIILYPGPKAVNVTNLPRHPVGMYDDAAVIAIDGTWSQSKGMYSQNLCLQHVKQVQVSATSISEYVIRTQPTKNSLSTLECIAHTLSWLENNDSLIEVLLLPLRALCQYQLNHGAVRHHSKDDPSYIPRMERKYGYEPHLFTYPLPQRGWLKRQWKQLALDEIDSSDLIKEYGNTETVGT